MTSSRPRRVAFRTFGCRLNQYDSEAMRTLLEGDEGYETAAPGETADVYVINTCSVTARADASARKAIRRLRKEYPTAKLVVAGCYAQRAPEEIARLSGVALVLGTPDRARIVEEITAAESEIPRIAVSPVDAESDFLDVPVTDMLGHTRAVVKVQDGCNQDCSYCIIPQTRGHSVSREPQQVIEQVGVLVAGGYPEVVISGVHVGDYGLDLKDSAWDLPRLLRALLAVPGLERLRLSSIEPASINHELIDLMASDRRFARHFHIPLQSGSDSVLERMGRCYRAADFSELVERIAATIPDCGIGSDLICGFPGETEDDFEQTLERLRATPLSYLHAFPYSIRPGSPAEAFGDQVPGDIKKQRVRMAKRLVSEKNERFRRAQVGQRLRVLFEQVKGKGPSAGWSDNYLRVELPGETGITGMKEVEITGLSISGLTAIVC